MAGRKTSIPTSYWVEGMYSTHTIIMYVCAIYVLPHRYYLIQKAKESRTVGILVGTLGAGESV